MPTPDAPVVGQIKCVGCGATVDLKRGSNGLFARCSGTYALACRTVTHYGPVPSQTLLKDAGAPAAAVTPSKEEIDDAAPPTPNRFAL